LIAFPFVWILAGLRDWSSWQLHEWLLVFLVPSAVLIALVLLVGRLPRQKAMKQSINRLNKEMPDYVLELMTQDP
jgi:hypothetical protein